MRFTIALILSLFANFSFAEIYTVDDDGPADFNNIQSAIDASEDGDIIIVQPGHYDGVRRHFPPVPHNCKIIHFLGKNITLTSINPSNFDTVSSTVINATVMFKGTEGPSCLLSGFKIYGYGTGGTIGNGYEVNEFSLRSKATITNCIFQRYYTAWCIYACDGLIENCILADNENSNAVWPIPAIEHCYGTIKNCTIANNEGSSAIYVGPNEGQLTVQNSIIYGNQALLYGNQAMQIYVPEGSSIDISYCDIQGGLSGIQGPGTVLCGPGNIDIDPCFVREGFWNIGEGDYHLKSEAGRWDPNTQAWVYDDVTSPCIDAGNPGCPLSSEPNDPNNLRINMGAFGGKPLASKTPPGWALLADLTNDGLVDFNDFSYQANDWLKASQCQPGDLNRDSIINFADIELLIIDWLKQTIWYQP